MSVNRMLVVPLAYFHTFIFIMAFSPQILSLDGSLQDANHEVGCFLILVDVSSLTHETLDKAAKTKTTSESQLKN